MIVIDDRLLRAILLEDAPPALERLTRANRIATTSCWLYRLCQAAVDPTVRGSLSGPIAALPGDLRSGVIASLIRLPDEIELVSWRDLAWRMAELVQRHRLNLLALEALAVATQLGADLVLARSTPPPQLVAAARIERVKVRLI